jgi:hypothetical protein
MAKLQPAGQILPAHTVSLLNHTTINLGMEVAHKRSDGCSTCEPGGGPDHGGKEEEEGCGQSLGNIGRANIVSLGGENAGGGTRTGSATPGRQSKAARMEGAGYRLSNGRPFARSLLPSMPSRKYGKAEGGGRATIGVGAFRSKDNVANGLLLLLGGGGGGEATVGGTWADTSNR